MNPVPRDKPPGRLKNWKAIFIHWKILCFIYYRHQHFQHTAVCIRPDNHGHQCIPYHQYCILCPVSITGRLFLLEQGGRAYRRQPCRAVYQSYPGIRLLHGRGWLQESLKLFHFAGLLLVFVGMVLFNRKIYDAD
jgi:hypothetical protein